jgi:hypothetical protein
MKKLNVVIDHWVTATRWMISGYHVGCVRISELAACM